MSESVSRRMLHALVCGEKEKSSRYAYRYINSIPFSRRRPVPTRSRPLGASRLEKCTYCCTNTAVGDTFRHGIPKFWGLCHYACASYSVPGKSIYKVAEKERYSHISVFVECVMCRLFPSLLTAAALRTNAGSAACILRI